MKTKTNLLKPLFASVLAISATFSSFIATADDAPVPLVVPNAPEVAAEGYVLMDYHSGKILAEKNMDERRHPASLTKMLTSYVIGQSIKAGTISRDDDVVISNEAWSQNPVFEGSSKMFIEVGKTVSVEDLNQGIIIDSGNDACVAMAEHIAGSQDAFVSVMNQWASKIGMKNSHFTNVHGLDNDELYSTPYDLALLGQALIRDVPDEYALYKQKEFTYNGIKQYNRNGLLWDNSMNVDGIKTGHTSGAGYNLVTSATEGKMRLVAVVMGTKSSNARKAESKKLLNFGFRFFETVSPHKAGDNVASHKIWMGDKSDINLGIQETTFVTLPRGQAKNLTAEIKIEDELRAPVAKGEKVGTLSYQLDGNTIAEYQLVAQEDVNEGGFFSRFLDYLMLLIQSWF